MTASTPRPVATTARRRRVVRTRRCTATRAACTSGWRGSAIPSRASWSSSIFTAHSLRVRRGDSAAPGAMSPSRSLPHSPSPARSRARSGRRGIAGSLPRAGGARVCRSLRGVTIVVTTGPDGSAPTSTTPRSSTTWSARRHRLRSAFERDDVHPSDRAFHPGHRAPAAVRPRERLLDHFLGPIPVVDRERHRPQDLRVVVLEELLEVPHGPLHTGTTSGEAVSLSPSFRNLANPARSAPDYVGGPAAVAPADRRIAGSEVPWRTGRRVGGSRSSTRSSSVPGSAGCTCCTGCASSASRRGSSRRPAGSAAPGTGTAIRGPAATSRAWSTRTSSRPSSSRSGSGRSATRPSPRSSPTRTTSPTASTSAATSGSKPGCASRRSTRTRTVGRSPSTDARGTREVSAQFLIMATGCLSSAKLPEIPGIDTFAGPTYHTGRWPHEGVDFTGQRVAVIGTGFSGVQSIPVIAEQASELYVFQRTPAFSVPAHNAPLDPEDEAAIKADYAAMRERDRLMRSRLRLAQPAERRLRAGGRRRRAPARVRAPLGDRRPHLPRRVQRPAHRASTPTRPRPSSSAPRSARSSTTRTSPTRLMPHTVIGCKRLCLDTNYYETYNRPNVTLVDVGDDADRARSPPPASTPVAVEYELDAIVFATGFDAMTGALLAIDIRGRDGLSAPREVGRRPAHVPRPGRRRASRTCSRSRARAAHRC